MSLLVMLVKTKQTWHLWPGLWDYVKWLSITGKKKQWKNMFVSRLLKVFSSSCAKEKLHKYDKPTVQDPKRFMHHIFFIRGHTGTLSSSLSASLSLHLGPVTPIESAHLDGGTRQLPTCFQGELPIGKIRRENLLWENDWCTWGPFFFFFFLSADPQFAPLLLSRPSVHAEVLPRSESSKRLCVLRSFFFLSHKSP